MAGVLCSPIRLSGHSGNVWGCSFSSICDLLASSSSDETVRIWDLCTSRTCVVFEDHSGVVHACDFCPNSNLIASCSWDKTTRIQDVSTGKTELVLRGHEYGIVDCCFSPDGGMLATCSWDNATCLWDIRNTSKPFLCILKEHRAPVVSAGFSSDSRSLITSSWDRTVRVWDLVRCERTHSLVGHTDVVWCVSYSSCCTNIAASCSRDRHVIIWDTERGCELFRLPEMSEEVHSVRFGYESTYIAVGVGDTNVYLLDTKDTSQFGVYQGHRGAVYCCRFSPGNQWLATASADKTVGLWNLSSSLYRESPIQNLVDSMNSVSLLDDV